MGQTVRAIREDHGISQAELARLLDSSPSHVNKIEAGLRAPTVVTLEALARALRVDMADLVRGAPGSASSNPPAVDPLLVEIVGALRRQDHRYLVSVRAFLKLLDQHEQR